MATIAAAEARVLKGEAAIRAREASGRPVPDTWLDAYDEAMTDLIATRERAAPEETRRYRATPTYRRMQERAQAGPLVQGQISISAGVR